MRYSATAGLPFDDNELESKLVWIWGSPRSGSTWLLEMLCHPFRMDARADLGFRWHPKWDGVAPALPVNEFQISAHLAPAIYGDPTPSAVVETDAGTLMPRTLDRLIDNVPGYAFSAAYADVWGPEVRRMTLVRLYAAIERARAAGLRVRPDLPLLVIKEVNGSHGADRTMPLFPGARMIFLVRDGRDVLDSLVDANSERGWLTRRGLGRGGFETPAERVDFVRENARAWTARMNACARAYDAHDPALRIKVRYEDLLAETARRLGELAGWLGLPAGAKRVEKIAARNAFETVAEGARGPGQIRRSAEPGAWRAGLTPEEQRVAHETMAQSLTALGYEI